MASARSHIRIAKPAGEVWAAVTDPTAIKDWFPGLANCTSEGNMRHVWVANGMEVDEEIVTNDGNLRRFQYKLVPGVVPVEHHLATIDVLDDGDGSLVVYGIDVQPEGFGGAMQQTADAAMAGLKAHFEG